jgi:hypothetical protein
MANTQSAQSNTEYFFGGLNGKITLVATIDPDNGYAELYENNNKAEIVFNITSLDELNNNSSFSAFPNPSRDQVNFQYNISRAPKNVPVKFYTLSGTGVDHMESVSAVNGQNKIIYNSGKLAPGQYVYKVSIDYGTEIVNFNGVLLKQ